MLSEYLHLGREFQNKLRFTLVWNTGALLIQTNSGAVLEPPGTVPEVGCGYLQTGLCRYRHLKVQKRVSETCATHLKLFGLTRASSRSMSGAGANGVPVSLKRVQWHYKHQLWCRVRITDVSWSLKTCGDDTLRCSAGCRDSGEITGCLKIVAMLILAFSGAVSDAGYARSSSESGSSHTTTRVR